MKVFSILFSATSGIVLTLIAAAKSWEALQSTQVLNAIDPVIPISNRQLMMLTAWVEMATAVILFRFRTSTVSFVCLLWLASCFLLYQGGRVLVGAREPCSCLGIIMSWLPLGGSAMRSIPLLIASFLFLGSAIILLHRACDAKPGGK